MLRVLETIVGLAKRMRRVDDSEALRQHAGPIWEDCQRGIDTIATGRSWSGSTGAR